MLSFREAVPALSVRELPVPRAIPVVLLVHAMLSLRLPPSTSVAVAVQVSVLSLYPGSGVIETLLMIGAVLPTMTEPTSDVLAP